MPQDCHTHIRPCAGKTCFRLPSAQKEMAASVPSGKSFYIAQDFPRIALGLPVHAIRKSFEEGLRNGLYCFISHCIEGMSLHDNISRPPALGRPHSLWPMCCAQSPCTCTREVSSARPACRAKSFSAAS